MPYLWTDQAPNQRRIKKPTQVSPGSFLEQRQHAERGMGVGHDPEVGRLNQFRILPHMVDNRERERLAGRLHESAADPASGLAEMLAAFNVQQKQLMEMANMAQKFGQDTSILMPVGKQLMQAQMRQLSEAIAAAQMAPSATQITPNVPAPQMPKVR